MDERPMRCEELAELAPALALDALEASERELVEAHARRCPDCARELTEYRQVAAQLALSLPQHEPPPGLGRRLLAIAERDREAVGARPAVPLPTAAPPPYRPIAPSPRRGWLQRVAPALSLASLAVAIVAILWSLSLQAQLAATQRQLAESNAQFERLRGSYWTVASVLAAPEVEIHDLQPDAALPNAAGKVWVDPASGRGMIMARELPLLPPNQVYQVWLSNAAGRAAAGQLRPNEDGVYYVVLQAPGKLTDYSRLGVTVEPAGPPPAAPSGQRVISGEI